MQSSTENSPVPGSQLPKLKGHIELIIGPMFAGKSTELVRRIKRHEIAGSRCLRIKYSGDCRYSNDSIATHDRQTLKAVACSKLEDLGDEYKSYDVIGIDEGQFFPDVLSFSENAANDGKVVIISALDGTFLRTGFESILQLIPKAEKVKKLQAICKNCNQNASFSFRTTSSNQIQQIGGTEAYKPLCRECFNEETRLKDQKEQIQKMVDQNEQLRNTAPMSDTCMAESN